MALLTTAQLRDYVRGSAADDTTIGELRVEALGLIQAELGRTIEAGGTFGSARGYTVTRSVRYGDDSATVTLPAGGTLGPLVNHAGYATWIEPMLNAALRATVADWTQNRNPGAESESGAGISVSYQLGALPKRAKEILAPLKGLTD